MSKFVVIVMALVAVAVGSVIKRQAPTAYVLPDGVELILGQINGGFSCEGRIYGYYADVNNDCRIFHVCLPVTLADGVQETHTFSFFCGNQTVFDQANLVCQHQDDATPCSQAEGFYSVNENFGKTDRPLLRA
ncbi:hypothetical protein CHUAL_009978 [Chamberlinius hualienensis]